MTKLSVNVNKIATLRNARGENNPDLLAMSLLIESLGAHGITVHPRPDERHILKSDVFKLKKSLSVELNIEGFPSDDFIALIHEIRPAQVTLVPDPPHVLTSNAGFNLREDFSFVSQAIKKLQNSGARVSIFVEPKDFIGQNLEIIKDTGTDRIELYTQRFAMNSLDTQILDEYKNFAMKAHNLGLGVNAGHDLSLNNLGILLSAVPIIQEVSIGHALICDALILGMPETVKRYLKLCSPQDN